MGLIVQKFGGSSVADVDRVQAVAKRITETYRRGERLVVVLSAQGDTTDQLIARAGEMNPYASDREMDMLLSTGEQVSCALCAMAIQALGCPVVSLTGWQAGVRTSSEHRNARIEEMDVERIRTELEKGRIVLVTGFQGVDGLGDITTLGRGGSDTSAVALAAALNADRCQIFTDVEGVYTADPRLVPQAKKLESISYDEMLTLATLGAQVLHDRCVALARDKGVELEVLSSFSDTPGTLVRAFEPDSALPVSGVARLPDQETDTALVSAVGEALLDQPHIVTRVRAALTEAGIGVQKICLDRHSLSLTVALDQSEQALRLVHQTLFI